MPTLNDQSSFLKMSLSSLMIIFVHFNFVAWSFPNSKECCDKVFKTSQVKWVPVQNMSFWIIYIYRKVLFYKPSRCPNTPIKLNLSALELVESGSSLSKSSLVLSAMLGGRGGVFPVCFCCFQGGLSWSLKPNDLQAQMLFLCFGGTRTCGWKCLWCNTTPQLVCWNTASLADASKLGQFLGSTDGLPLCRSSSTVADDSVGRFRETFQLASIALAGKMVLEESVCSHRTRRLFITEHHSCTLSRLCV